MFISVSELKDIIAFAMSLDNEVKCIDFPPEEYESVEARLRSGKRLITHRSYKEYDKYHVDDVLRTPFGFDVTVVFVTKLPSIESSPYVSYLTQEQLDEIGDAPVDLIRLQIVNSLMENYLKKPAARMPKIPKGMKFYHASPIKFHYGDMLTGGHEGGSGHGHHNVCMTTSPVAHATIQCDIPYTKDYNPKPSREQYEEWGKMSKEVANAAQDAWLAEKLHQNPAEWFVYEVEPIGTISYVEGNNEYQASAAKVIKVIGKARAILQKHSRSDNDSIAWPPYVQRHRELKRKERILRHDVQDDDDDS